MTEHHRFIQQAALSITNKYVPGCRSTSSNSRINLIKVDISLNKGHELAFRRVYIQEADSGDLATVGWILPCDISCCMICASPFGYTFYKNSCAACGNVVCSNCATSSSFISNVEFPKPVVVCCQCCWGQEIVDVSPNLELGVPLYIKDLPAQYGPCSLQQITPVRVLKSRRSQGESHIFINICTSPSVPLNHHLTNDRTPRRNRVSQQDHQIVDKNSFYYMVCGPESFGVGGVFVYDVAVHPKVVAQSNPETGADPSLRTDLSMFFDQVLRLVERVSAEPVSDSYITHSQCTYYRNQLSQVDNQRMANALDPTLGKISLPIPTLEAFRDLYQIGVKPSDIRSSSTGASGTRRNSRSLSSPSPAASNVDGNGRSSSIISRSSVVLGEVTSTTGNRIRSPSVSSISSIPVTPFDLAVSNTRGVNSGAASSTGESSSSDEESASPHTGSGNKSHSKIRSASVTIGGKGGSLQQQQHQHHVKRHSSLLLLGERVPSNEGRALINADMVVHYKEKDIDGRNVNMLKAAAVRVPKTLVGWQIALLSPEMKSTGIYVVTAIRKSTLFKSEYRLSNFLLDDQWVLLKRSPTKKGHNFQPLRKVFTPNSTSDGGSVLSK